MTATADVTVVIPTHDRPALLRRCLEALTEQTVIPTEVIVVDDGSATPVRDLVDDYAARLPVRVIRHDVARRAAAARNAGWSAAGSALVAFTDDDCRPDRRWLERLTELAAQADIVVGRTMADGLDGPIRSVFDRSFEAEGLNMGFPTCNILYPRRVLEAVGGFDQDFQAWGEDTDLAFRAIEGGATVIYQPEALVYHAVHRRGLWPTLRARWRMGEVVRLARRHPNQWGSISRAGIFLHPYHRATLGLLAGCALLPVSPVFMLLGVPWGEDCVNRRRNHTHDERPVPRLRLSLELVGLAMLDTVEVTSCLAWSVKERTLLV
jgi:GT2 family glycosyltransferase